jgi:hypothetical protein
MAEKWYYGRGDEQFGPFSADQLKELAATGQILPADSVWKEGMTRGVLASKVKHLFAAPPRQAPDPGGPVPKSVPDPAEAAETVASAAVTPEPAPKPPAARENLAARDPRLAEPPQEQPETRKKRVLSVKGGIISSQDGVVVKFRKQCLRCGQKDTSITTMPIPNGHVRVNFFCPKCKKNQLTEVHGVN